MGSPRHLWTGGWRAESERAREAAERAAELRRPAHAQPFAATGEPAEAPEGSGAGGSRRLTLLLGLLLAAAATSVRTNAGGGTGFLIDLDRCMLVTNAHVVGSATHVLVRFGQDGDPIDGDVLGVDPSSDLAVVSVDPDRVPRGAKALRFADSRAVQVGDL